MLRGRGRVHPVQPHRNFPWILECPLDRGDEAVSSNEKAQRGQGPPSALEIAFKGCVGCSPWRIPGYTSNRDAGISMRAFFTTASFPLSAITVASKPSRQEAAG